MPYTPAYSIPFSWRDRTDKVQLASAKGLGLEIGVFSSGEAVDDPWVRSDYEARLRAKLKRFPGAVSYHAAFKDLAVHSGDALIANISRQRILEDLRMATRLGCQKVVFHTGFNPLVPAVRYRDEFMRIHAEFWPRMAAAFPDVQICLENQWEPDPAIFVKLMEHISHPSVRVCLDVAHAHAYSTCSVANWMRVLAPFIGHMHWNDNLGDTDSHMAVGDGSIDWRDVLLQTAGRGDKVSVVLELASIKEIEKSMAHLAALSAEVSRPESDWLPGHYHAMSGHHANLRAAAMPE
jgi:sugar phosphate isomerase/epimerase